MGPGLCGNAAASHRETVAHPRVRKLEEKRSTRRLPTGPCSVPQPRKNGAPAMKPPTTQPSPKSRPSGTSAQGPAAPSNARPISDPSASAPPPPEPARRPSLSGKRARHLARAGCLDVAHRHFHSGKALTLRARRAGPPAVRRRARSSNRQALASLAALGQEEKRPKSSRCLGTSTRAAASTPSASGLEASASASCLARSGRFRPPRRKRRAPHGSKGWHARVPPKAHPLGALGRHGARALRGVDLGRAVREAWPGERAASQGERRRRCLAREEVPLPCQRDRAQAGGRCDRAGHRAHDRAHPSREGGHAREGVRTAQQGVRPGDLPGAASPRFAGEEVSQAAQAGAQALLLPLPRGTAGACSSASRSRSHAASSTCWPSTPACGSPRSTVCAGPTSTSCIERLSPR